MDNKIKVIALDTYTKKNIKDGELGYKPKEGTEFEVSEERLKVLLGENKYNLVFVKVIEETIDENEVPEDAENEETINESDIVSVEATDEVPEGAEVKESVTIIPDLEEKTVEELKVMAEEKGIELKSSMKKAEIIEAIRKELYENE